MGVIGDQAEVATGGELSDGFANFELDQLEGEDVASEIKRGKAEEESISFELTAVEQNGLGLIFFVFVVVHASNWEVERTARIGVCDN